MGIPAYDRHLHGFYHRSDIKVLDFGTGSARLPQHLTTHGIPAENITGVELSEELVRIAKKNIPGATFIHGDITKVRLPPNYFDLITSNMVFEFLDENGLEQALTNAHKSLKPKGIILFITTHPDKMKTDSGLDTPGPFETTFPWGEKGPNYYRTLTDFTLASRKAGFEIEQIEELGIPPEAEKIDPKEYARYAAYPYIRLVVKARKP